MMASKCEYCGVKGGMLHEEDCPSRTDVVGAGEGASMACGICGKPNPNTHQEFCVDLGCSGRMIARTAMEKPVAKREGVRCIEGHPDGEVVVSMITFRDKMYCATNQNVYVLGDDEKFRPVSFEFGVPEDQS